MNEEIEPKNETVEIQEQQPVEQQPEVEPKFQEKTPEYNWKELRSKAEKLQKERDEALAYAQSLEQQKQHNENDLNDNELVEGKHLNRFQKKVNELEKQLNKYKQFSEEATVEIQLKNKFPDFDQVVTESSLKQLRETDPELAESINYNPNLYNKAAAAYKAVKNMHANHDPNREIMQRNLSKPRTLSSIDPQSGDTPLSSANAFANGLTKEVKQKLWAEMQEARKNSSNQ